MASPNRSQFMPDNKSMEKIKNTITNIRHGQYKISKYISDLPTQTKMIIVFCGIITIVLLFYYLLYKKGTEIDHVTFLNGLSKNPPTPWNAKNHLFKWKDKSGTEFPYIPSSQLKLVDYKQYTISFWIYPRGSLIKSEETMGDWSYKYGQWKHILHIGNWHNEKTTQQSPGFWLSPKLNRLNVIIDTMQEKERIVIDNIDLNSWSNVTAVLDNFSISIYINGRLEKTITLRYQPMNLLGSNLWIAKKGGYSGYLSYISVYSTPLEPDAVYNIYKYYLPQIEKWYNYEINDRDIAATHPIGPYGGYCGRGNGGDSGGGSGGGGGDSGGGGGDSGGGGGDSGGGDSGGGDSGGGDSGGFPDDSGGGGNICQ